MKIVDFFLNFKVIGYKRVFKKKLRVYDFLKELYVRFVVNSIHTI